MSKLTLPKNILQNLHFVSGNFASVGSLKPFKVYEPRSGCILTEIRSINRHELNNIVQDAKKAQVIWSNTSWQERGQVLRETARIIRENVPIISEWEVRDNGKPINEAVTDIQGCAEIFDYFGGIDLSGQYLPYHGLLDQYAYTSREPFGVVGALGAWNYPIQTATWKIAPAIACGNAMIYKPSPFAPITSSILAHILALAGVPNGLVSVVQGEAETGAAICEHEDIRKVSFTGSVATGKKIAQNSNSNNVKPVTLELGGKSACIVFSDADVDLAVNGALMANFYSQV